METAGDIIENLIHDLITDLTDSNEIVLETIAEANAAGFLVDSYEIDADFTDSSKNKINFRATIELIGEQDSEGFHCNDQIFIRLTGKAIKDEWEWKVDDIEIVECNLKKD